MHELSLVTDMLEIAERHARDAGASSIRVIALRVGARSGVDPEALEFAFSVAKIGTLAAEARLEVERVPMHAVCRACQLEFDVEARFGIARCPSCGQPSARLTHGEELEVRALEVI
jgi:hydrogenase nickel incorporation protein HypA/HybF